MVANKVDPRVEFKFHLVALAKDVHDLAFEYPGELEEPGYCLLNHAAELLDLINELHLV